MPHPQWINDYVKSGSQLYAGQVLEGLAPLDFFHFFPLWYDLFLERFDGALEHLERQSLPTHEHVRALPSPSSLRAIIQKLVPSFPHVQFKNDAAFRRVVTTIVETLHHLVPDDPFAYASNRDVRFAPLAHDGALPLLRAEGEDGKLMGTATLAFGHLVNGLYNDFVTDLAWDTYGPYAAPHFGDDAVLIIRDFSDLAPRAVWPEQERWLSASRVRTFAVYCGVDIAIQCVGCHVVSAKPLAQHLVAWAVEVDGRFVDRGALRTLVDEALTVAADHYMLVKSLSDMELREKVLVQECYQLKQLCARAGMSWRPSDEMRSRIHLPMPQGLYPMGTLMDEAAYRKHFGIETLQYVFSQFG